MQKTKLSIRNKTIGTAATPEEKAEFENFCAKHGRRPAQMLRMMLSRVCPKIEAGELPEKHRLDSGFFMSLTKIDARALEDKAKQESISRQDWVRNLIRKALLRVHPFHVEEIAVLLESNRQLHYLGHNMNQIAHNLNISPNAADQANAETLKRLETELRTHMDRVSQMINANWGRWGGDDL